MRNKKTLQFIVFLTSTILGNIAYANCTCEKYNDPNTPINQAILAMTSGNYDNSLALKLLNSGSSPNITNSCGAGLLLIASIYNDTKLVRKLLLNGANPNIKNFEGISPVFFASAFSNNNTLKLLVDAGGDTNAILNPCSEEEYNTPLLTAAINNNIDGIKILIKNKANHLVNTRGGMSFFDILILRGDIDPILDIIESSPSNKKEDISNHFIFSTSSKKDFNHLLDELLSRNYNYEFSIEEDVPYDTPLMIAALNRNTKGVKKLISYGADINYTNSLNYSLKRVIEENKIKELYYIFPNYF